MTFSTKLLTHKKTIIRLAIWFFLILPIGAFFVVSAAIITYIFWPNSYNTTAPFEFGSAKHVFFISHGLKDNSLSWPKALKTELDHRFPNAIIINFDWSLYAENALTCSVNGIRIGEYIGEQLAESRVETLHLIGHSCGSFINLGMCKAIKQTKPAVFIQTTYLDPVSIYGGLFFDYGIDNFGKCANYSETFFDIEDGVPGSNQALTHSHSVDVTPYKTQFDFNGPAHLWPTEFYIEHVKGSELIDIPYITPQQSLAATQVTVK